MPTDATLSALDFIASTELPTPPLLSSRAAKNIFDYDSAKEQALVVGSEVIAFVKGITPEQRTDLVNASLLAQLAAKKKVANPQTLASVEQWYNEYFDGLSRIGFLIQDKGLAEYQEASESFEAHEAILDIATTFLAGMPGALALVTTTLRSLQKMSTDSHWIRLFNRESRSANTARFQMSLVSEDEQGRLLVSLITFGLEAQTTLTQVLFFKFHTNEVKLHHHSGEVTISAPLLAAVREQIANKLVAYASDYIKGLPDL